MSAIGTTDGDDRGTGLGGAARARRCISLPCGNHNLMRVATAGALGNLPTDWPIAQHNGDGQECPAVVRRKWNISISIMNSATTQSSMLVQ